MRIGSFQFAPRIIPTLVTLVLFPALISLGFWQLSRTDEKRELLADQQRKSQLPPLKIVAENPDPEEIEYRRLIVTGRYLTDYQVLVDNKVHQGQTGYNVVTPLQIEDSDYAVLINRGWVKADVRREIRPDIKTPQGRVSIRGTAKFKTKDIVTFNDRNRLADDWPALVRWVDIEELDKDIPYKLKPFLLLQAEDMDGEYVRDWSIVNSPPEKNMSYAVQWFTLAGVLMLIFFMVNTRKIQKQDRT
ncbi:MAG: SURF1 family protein [Thioalkalispiraceae bacterium]|jgi:surfeit locus 1 family protein